MVYSYKQPNLCTLIADRAGLQGHEEWHLPTFNERNEQKYLYAVHSLDVYLWTEKDAATLLGHLKAVLPADKQDIRDAPSTLQKPAEHRDSMSPVVQQLEKTAIASNFPPRAESTTSAMSLPGPPTPATSAGAAQSPQLSQPQPLAYNPAAPAAPETRYYREKTPPPPDDGTGTGLGHAANYDTMPQQQYANVPTTFGPNSNQHTPQQAYFSGPPPQQQQQIPHPSMTTYSGPPTPGMQIATPGSLPPPPPPPTGAGPSPQQYNPSFGPPPNQNVQTTSPPPNQQNFPRQSTFGAPVTQYASFPQQQTPSFGPAAMASPGMTPGTPGYGGQNQPPTPSAPPAYAGHTPIHSPGLPPPPPGQPQPQQYQPAQQQQQGQYQQAFSYSNYNYGQAQGQAQGYGGGGGGGQAGYTGDVHNQVYRPTEAEALGHGQRPQPAQRVNSETRQKVEGKVDQVEKKVGGLLKRLDKMW